MISTSSGLLVTEEEPSHLKSYVIKKLQQVRDVDELTKNKRRALRRKRNFVAKTLLEDRQFRPKIVQKKRTRRKLRVLEIEQYLEEAS
mgnify:FL=1